MPPNDPNIYHNLRIPNLSLQAEELVEYYPFISKIILYRPSLEFQSTDKHKYIMVFEHHDFKSDIQECSTMKGNCPSCGKETDLEFVITTERLKLCVDHLKVDIKVDIKHYKCLACKETFKGPRCNGDLLFGAYKECCARLNKFREGFWDTPGWLNDSFAENVYLNQPDYDFRDDWLLLGRNLSSKDYRDEITYGVSKKSEYVLFEATPEKVQTDVSAKDLIIQYAKEKCDKDKPLVAEDFKPDKDSEIDKICADRNVAHDTLRRYVSEEGLLVPSKRGRKSNS